MRTLNKLFFSIILVIVLSGCNEKHDEMQIGIIVPMEHQALREIVTGFEFRLQQLYKKPISFKVMNAQGDANLQRAIIEQMDAQNYKIIVSVATSTSQMTVSIIHDKPIVALAANISDAERHSIKSCNMAIIDDEIDKTQIITFIHNVYPQLKNLTLVYSASDKIFPDVALIKKAAQMVNINVTGKMVQSLPELQSASQAIPLDTQAIFILKDSLIASGVATLIQVANLRHIPLITSDDSTVHEGAGFAIGVHEKQIGMEGAELAAKILQSNSACDLPIAKMTKPSVFINPKALLLEQQNIALIKKIAQQMQYPVETISGE